MNYTKIFNERAVCLTKGHQEKNRGRKSNFLRSGDKENEICSKCYHITRKTWIVQSLI